MGNKAYPESSIVEGYISEEGIYFYSKYLEYEVRTKSIFEPWLIDQ